MPQNTRMIYMPDLAKIQILGYGIYFCKHFSVEDILFCNL